jgi:2-keto-4-pentenoate hydratase/2-oxohepta-3-ene-1,7-dioic acid hydratase in catechol pathway
VKYRDSVYYASIDDASVRLLNDKDVSLEVARDEVTVLRRVVVPGKIICVGLNYRAHAREMDLRIPGEPLLFFKPPSAVIGNQESIVCPEQSMDVHYEGELALVISRRCRNVTREEAKNCLLGVTCANDVTARDLQKTDGLYARAKGFDTFCPLGPWIETSIQDPGNMLVRTYVNGHLKQEGSTSDMIFDPYTLVSFVSRIMTLEPGDVLLTGTPPGIGPILPGDVVQVTIEGVGVLENDVISRR